MHSRSTSQPAVGTSLRIASWNVNSIRARLDAVVSWLETQNIEVLCLQETKVTDDAFPADAFRKIGYDVAVFGQKTYNGVAIATTRTLNEVSRGFDDEALDAEGARLLGAHIDDFWVYSAYVPNGKVVGSAAYEMKLRWLAGLRTLLSRRHRPENLFAVCGDFNIAAEERDVHDPWFWRTQVLFHDTARHALQDFCSLGLEDTFRLHHQESGLYSWWDYRKGAFPKNEGLRIDYVFASQGLAARCRDARIDRDPRGQPSPSDHTPVIAAFETPSGT
jgi:exodeoxyribonuclease-3